MELYRSPMAMRFWNDVATAQAFEGGYSVRKLSDFPLVAIFIALPNPGE